MLKDEDRIKSQYHIRVFNITGQLVKDVPFNTSIDVSNLQSGIYFLQLLSENGSTESVQKFIINR
ncbi:MAG: hypothetical protein DRI84_10305 [Bacteroidetes bacterium]|nr:MAG: hypothetical protein DRI84_10305 [Bacteroidota bacterium]